MENLGGIAGIIAASAFLILALAVAVPLVRLGKVMNEAARTVRVTTDEIIPVIKEAQHSLHSINSIVDRVENMTASAAKVVDKVKEFSDHPASALFGLAKNFKNFVPGSTRE